MNASEVKDILVINPGSTSTKITIYTKQNTEILYENNIVHDEQKILEFPTVASQKNYRKGIILDELNDKGYDLKNLTAVVGRGGMLFGTIEFIICIVTIIFVDKQSRRKNLIAMFAMILIATVFLLSASDLIAVYLQKMNVDSGEVRWKLYKDAWENFKHHPIFGVGLCYSGNQAATWVPKTGAINWYQNSVLQVLASFGIVGAIAYAFQFYCRVKVLLRCHTKFNYTVFLSYLGLGLMSLVNPGLFSPIPYLFILTMMFVIVEKKNEEMLDTSDLIELIRFNSVLRNIEAKVERTLKKR